MFRKRRRTWEKRSVCTPAWSNGAVAGLVLRALLGEVPEVEIGGRRYRLGLQKVFRLEEIDGSFAYYLRNAGALHRRLIQLGAPATWEISGNRGEHQADN